MVERVKATNVNVATLKAVKSNSLGSFNDIGNARDADIALGDDHDNVEASGDKDVAPQAYSNGSQGIGLSVSDEDNNNQQKQKQRGNKHKENQDGDAH